MIIEEIALSKKIPTCLPTKAGLKHPVKGTGQVMGITIDTFREKNYETT